MANLDPYGQDQPDPSQPPYQGYPLPSYQDISAGMPPLPPPPQGAHPAHGFLDRLAIALAQHPVQYQPMLGGHNSAPNFLGGLLSGFGNGYGQNRAQPIAQYAQWMDDNRKALAEQNQAAIKATLDARGGVATANARSAGDIQAERIKNSAKVTPPEKAGPYDYVDPITGETLPGFTRGAVMREQFINDHKPKEVKPGSEPLTNDDLVPATFTSTATTSAPQGHTYVDGNKWKGDNAGARQARRLARLAGQTYLEPDDSTNLTQVDTARRQLSQEVEAFRGVLATHPGAQYMTLNKFKKEFGTDTRLSGLGNWFATNVNAFKTIANQGKGTIRITNPEITKIIENSPDYEKDTLGKMLGKVGTVDSQLQDIVDRPFIKDRSKWFNNGGGALPPGVKVVSVGG